MEGKKIEMSFDGNKEHLHQHLQDEFSRCATAAPVPGFATDDLSDDRLFAGPIYQQRLCILYQ